MAAHGVAGSAADQAIAHVGAMLDTPIWVGGRMIGVLCNEHLGPARTWSVVEEFVAGLLAQHAAVALLSSERHAAEEQLRLLAGELESIGGG